MPTALTFDGNTIKGVALEGLAISPRLLQFRDSKFWGVNGVNRLYGRYGQRHFVVPVLIYDESNVDFDTPEKLANYIDETLNGDLNINSESDHSTFDDVSYEGCELREGPKKDTAGTLGGGYWAIVFMHFTQLS
jgi:hypothetical protein